MDATMEAATAMERVPAVLVGLVPLATSNFAQAIVPTLLAFNLATMEHVSVMKVTLVMLVKTKIVLPLALMANATLLLERVTVM
jgi:hypothetical protein